MIIQLGSGASPPWTAAAAVAVEFLFPTVSTVIIIACLAGGTNS